MSFRPKEKTEPAAKENIESDTSVKPKDESASPAETESIADAFQEGIESEEKTSESTQEKVPEKSVEEQPKEEESAEPESEAEKPRIVTPTLGEIYAAQGQYEKAIKVFQELLEQNPQEIKYQQKIDEMQQKLKETL